jgi:hypothetical protein
MELRRVATLGVATLGVATLGVATNTYACGLPLNNLGSHTSRAAMN